MKSKHRAAVVPVMVVTDRWTSPTDFCLERALRTCSTLSGERLLSATLCMSTYRPISLSLFWSLYYALTHYTCVFMFSLLTLTRLLLRSTMSKEDRMADLLMLLPNTAKLNWVETGFSPVRHKQKGIKQTYNTRNTLYLLYLMLS